MIGDREQIEAIPLRLSGQPRRISCPADINAIPGALPTAEQHTAIWHHDLPLGSRVPAIFAPTVRAADGVKAVTVGDDNPARVQRRSVHKRSCGVRVTVDTQD
jgi:hypothetical protein